MTLINSYKDLKVWQRAVELVVVIYELTEKFPSEMKYDLVTQMRRAALSIPSNIVEGRYRRTKNDYLHFLGISNGSGAELETQIEVAKKIPKTKDLDYTQADNLLDEVMRMLNSMIRNMNPKN